MPSIPFPTGFEGSDKLPRTNKILQNIFNTGENRILSRPGITELNTTGKVARGNFEWNGSLYQVVSTSLIKITDLVTGAFTIITGSIEGSGPVETAIGFNDAVIVVPGGKTYSLDKSDVLTDISVNAEFVPFRDVAHIDNRFIYVPFDGSPTKFSDVGTAETIQPLSFFDAQVLPDNNVAVFVLRNTLYIMGTDSVEAFQNTGATPNPFSRISGAQIDNGFLGGLLEFDNTFLFIGKKTKNIAGIFAIGAGRATKVSNERIDVLLSTYTDLELAEAIPGRIIWNGFDIATFALRRDSFGFVNGKWFLLDTVFNGVSRPWGGGFIAQIGSDYYTAFSDKIGKFEDVNTDYGERITKIIGGGSEQDDGDYIAVQNLTLGLSQGFNNDIGSVALKTSDTNVQFGPLIYRNTGDLAEYDRKLRWNPPGGLGTYLGFFGYEISTSENINMGADQLIIEFQ